MNLEAKNESIEEFIELETNKTINIPEYQREYAWSKAQTQYLIDDIKDNDEQYYVGSIIWIDETKDIIDGQQRLVTISLLLTAIYKEKKDILDDDQKEKIKKFLVVNGKDNNPKTTRIVLQKQGKNQNDYEYLIKSEILGLSQGRPKSFGNRRIGINFYSYCDEVKDLDKEEISKLLNKIFKLTIISVKVDDPQSGYTLFEITNNRGLKLTAMDLIKNCYKSRNKDEAKEWESLINTLGEEYNQEQFFRNYFNAFKYKLNKDKDRKTIANKATRTNVISIYDKLIDQPYFMENINTAAKNNAHLTGEKDLETEMPEGYDTYFKRFRNANATSTFTLLLFLLDNQNTYNIKDKEMLNIFEVILRFAIRRNLTNNPSTGALAGLWDKIITDIVNSAKNYSDVYSIILNTLKARSSDDETVKKVLEGDIYDDHRDMARYLLCYYCEENDKYTKEEKTRDFWEKEKKKYRWTIEHILPEGDKSARNTPKCWIDMIRNGSAAYATFNNDAIFNLVKEYRHKIGNLTLTVYNSNLSAKSFINKRDLIATETSKKVGYANGLSLNDDVVKEGSWTIEKIKNRTIKLVNYYMDKLKL